MKILRIPETFLFFMIIIHMSYLMFNKNGSRLVIGDLKNKFHCENWNATIITKEDSLKKLIEATLEIFPVYKECFSRYFAYLHLLKSKRFDCDLKEGAGLKLKEVEEYSQGIFRSYKVSFTNLSAGYYCILFQPCSIKCHDTFLVSNVVRIEDSSTFATTQNTINKISTNISSDVAYIFVVSILTLLFIIVIYWSYKHRETRKVAETDVEKGSYFPLLPSNDDSSETVKRKDSFLPNSSDIKVFIFRYPDDDTKSRVSCFARFLKDCANFNVTVIDDSIHNILISGEPWSYFEDILDCCPPAGDGKCTCNKRYIIVMTEHVITYMQSKRKVAKALEEVTEGFTSQNYIQPSYSNEDNDMEADWFRYGLNRIITDFEKCFTDYVHFFVIYFNDNPYIEEHDVIPIAPKARFTICHQNQIVNLCQQLSNSFDDQSSVNKLLDDLKTHPFGQLVLNDL